MICNARHTLCVWFVVRFCVSETDTTIDGRITSQTTGNDLLYFYYDSDNSLLGFDYNGYKYLYVKNLQGDIVGIVDNTGAVVVEYAYDAWGKTISQTGALAEVNPFRYRGYYYDVETGLYYCQSRYYDPAVKRWISADDPALLDQLMSADEVLGSNLFAYCNNEPVGKTDPTGMFAPTPANIYGAVIGALLGLFAGVFCGIWLADIIGITGKIKRGIFIASVAALVGAGAAAIGYFLGPYVAKLGNVLFKALMKLLNNTFTKTIAQIIKKIVGGTITMAKNGMGWVIKSGDFTLRLMTSGGGRYFYLRLSKIGIGALTALGVVSSDRALTHIDMTLNNLIEIIKLILKY
jgi:RHS repeat-associated protein